MAFLAIGQMATVTARDSPTEQDNLHRLPRSLTSIFAAKEGEGEAGSYGYGR